MHMHPLPIKKVVFIEPKSPGRHVYTRWGLPRLGSLQLGAILKEAGYDVAVFIEDIHGIDFDEVFEADAVGISTITSTSPRAYEIARQIRKAGIPVFMGGPHVSFLPEEALNSCDYVLKGEAEESILPFMQVLAGDLPIEKVAGLSWKDGGIVRNNPMPEQCMDLDRYPFPDFGLIKGSKTFKGDLSITPIMTSRGCPFGCNFCSVTRMFGRRYRFRSVDNVMRELEERRPEWVFFYDDNFAANPAHTKELLRRIIASGLKPKWSAQVRIDVARDAELLDLMKQAGCYTVYIGLESINPKTLRALNKGQTPEQIEEAIRTIHSYGINIHGMFIFGSDHDDLGTFRETVKFARRLEIASVQLMILVPLPGTPVFAQMEAEGRLLSRDWGYYDGHHVVFQPRGMSYLQLQKQTIKAMLRFYSLGGIFSKLNTFNLWAMIARAYGWRMTRKMRRNMREFLVHLKEMYRQAEAGIDDNPRARKAKGDLKQLYHDAGEGISAARGAIEFKARKTSEDLKEYFHSINLEAIRRAKRERLEQWRASRKAGANPQRPRDAAT